MIFALEPLFWGDFPAGRRQMTSWSSKAVGTFYTPASRWHYQLRSGLTPWNLGAGGENSTLKSKLESLLTLLYSKVAGKFLTEMKGFDGKIICKWWIFHCHSRVQEGFWFLFWGSVGVSHPWEKWRSLQTSLKPFWAPPLLRFRFDDFEGPEPYFGTPGHWDFGSCRVSKHGIYLQLIAFLLGKIIIDHGMEQGFRFRDGP